MFVSQIALKDIFESDWCGEYCYFVKSNIFMIEGGLFVEAFCDAECWTFMLGATAGQKYDTLDEIQTNSSHGVCENYNLVDLKNLSDEAVFETWFDLNPINAWSSFFFIIVGNFFISKSFGEGSQDMVDAGHSNLFQRHPILPFIFGASFV